MTEFTPLSDEQVATLDEDRLAAYRALETATHAVQAAESRVKFLEADIVEAQKTLQLAIAAKREADARAPKVTHMDLVRKDLIGSKEQRP